MKVEIKPGMSVYQAAEYAKSIAIRSNLSEVSIVFNGIPLYVSSTSNSSDIAQIYSLKCQIERFSK